MLSSVLLFLNIGTSEMVLILFVALMLFGGDKLPGLARGLGKGIRDFKDASEGVKREIANQIENYEDKKAGMLNEVNHLVEGEPPAHEVPSFNEHITGSAGEYERHIANPIPPDEGFAADDAVEHHTATPNVSDEAVKAIAKEEIKSNEEYKS